MHYLRKALEPFAEVIEAPLADMLNAAPDVLVLADVGGLGEAEREALVPGSRRAGCWCASPGRGWRSPGAGQLEEDPLLPVRLRAGGRSIGGAMSWGAPRRLKPFPEEGPFAGLPVPADVDISSQVMAQPDPDLPGPGAGDARGRHAARHRQAARRRAGGAVPRHRQRRLVEPAALGAVRADARAADPERRRARRRPGDAGRARSGRRCRCCPASASSSRRASSPGCRASCWPRRGRRRRPRRASTPAASGGWRSTSCATDDRLAPLGPMPEGVVVQALEQPSEVRLGPWLIGLALLLLALDVLATLAVSGRLGAGCGRRPPRRAWCSGRARRSAAGRAEAQAGDDAEALYAANQTVLAYVETGNPRVDAVSHAGLSGLSQRALRPDRDRAGRAGGDRHRERRAVALPVPLLAGHREPGAAVGRGGGEAQRLPALRRHDPVRHPGRRPRRRRRARRRTAGRCSASPCGSTSRRSSRCRRTTC